MKFATSINSLLLLASAASACIYKRAEGQAEWGYTGLKGPLLWHTLDSANSKCAAGTNQSPINVAPATLQQAAVKLQYPSAGDFEVHNNGHTVELTPLEYGSTPDYSQSKYSVLLDGNTFKLAQFHFHTPSEHRLNDVSYPLEVHFVHTCPETKEFAVVGIFFDVVEGAGEDFTHKLAPPVGRHTGGGIRDVREKDQTAELKDIPFARIQKHLADHPASHYSGSLTTPPCTEDIKWYVSQTPMQIDVGEYQAFKEILKFNARYTQNSPGEPNLLAASCTAEDSTIDIMDISDSDSDVEDEEH